MNLLKYAFRIFISLCLLSACSQQSGDTAKNNSGLPPDNGQQIDEKAVAIIEKAVEQHGGPVYDNLQLEFDFRDRHYRGTRQNGYYRYERIFADSLGQQVHDFLDNNGFTRLVAGDTVALPAERIAAFSSSVNSVLYFVLLPALLRDPAVQASYLDTATVKGEPYHKVLVTFKQESGGEDFQDEYVYWFHQQTGLMDYLAYNYQTEGGGARFREAVNRRQTGGVTFSDYINYKPRDDNQAVASFDSLFENGQLQELSRIVTENEQAGTITPKQ